MAIRITCPGCDSALTLADDLRGKKVRCKKCQESIRVPGDEDPGEEQAVQTGTKLKAKTASSSSRSDEDEDDADDRPAKKKKKKKSSKGPPVMLMVVGAVILLVLIVGGGASAFYFLRHEPAAPKKNEQAKVDEKKEEGEKIRIIPKLGEGNPTGKKGGTGVDNSVRGAVYRAERRNELANIHKMFTAYELETPKSQRNTQTYLTYIQRDFRPVHDAIKEGYYKVNVKAQVGSNDILAGERDIDRPGHLVVRASGAIEHVPAEEFKKAFE